MGLTVRHVSLSKSALLLSPCIKWAGPQAKWYDEAVVDSDDMSKRDLGIAFHSAMDAWQTGKNWSIPEHMVRQMAHATTYMEQVLGPRCDTIQSEVAVGINWTTGEAEALPEVKNRDYPDRQGWQFGTADLVCVLKTGELLIADWKTGGNEGATEQLLSLACGFQRVILNEGILRPVRILCLQVNEDGVWPHEQDVNFGQISSHWDSMRFQWEDVGKRNEPVTGIHCTVLYCPHLAYCSGVAGVTQVASQADTGPLLAPVALMAKYQPKDVPDSDSDAGLLMSHISAARRQMKHQEAKLKDYVTKLGGTVSAGEYVWSEGNNGWRWRKAKERTMKNIKVGQVAEYFEDTVQVVSVNNNTKTFDLNYTDPVSKDPVSNESPPGFMNQPFDKLVDMGNGRVIWNHE